LVFLSREVNANPFTGMQRCERGKKGIPLEYLRNSHRSFLSLVGQGFECEQIM